MTVYHGLLQRRLELYLGGVWVDFSARLLTQTLSPNPGRTSGGNRVSPSTLNFSLDNPLGDITPYNAASTYYPHVDVGMLIRWSVYWDGNWHVRGVFEATEVQPHWPYGDLSDGTTTGQPGESYVAITAADILQRLSDDQQPLRSPLYRSMAGVAVGDYVPHGYWPMEDGADATRFASGIANGSTATFVGAINLAASADGLAGSEPLPTLGTGSSVLFPIATYTNTGQWVLQFALNVPAALTAETILFTAQTPSGTVVRWELTLNPNLVFPPALDFRIKGYNSSGSAVIDDWTTAETDTSAFAFYGNWVMGALVVWQNGGNISARVSLASPTRDAGGVADSVAGTAGALTGLSIPALGSSLNGVGMGHVGVFVDANFTPTVDDVVNAAAMDGYVGETAGRRLERVTREQGISFTSAGDLDETTPMGPQPIDTLITVLRDCEDADIGILHAQREANGLHYRTRVDLYSQAPALILDAAQNEIANPFRPAATAKHIVNDVTVNRPGGSSSRVIDQDSIDRVGLRTRGYDVNAETDDEAAQVGGWLLNLGTPDGMHYPSVSSELTIATQLIEDWLALNLGDRVQVVNLPPQHPTDTVDLLVDGYTEPHSPSRWTPQINCSPASPWTVAVLDDDDLGKLDTDGSELTASVNSSATALTVATLNMDSPLWTTDSGEMPVTMVLAGEVVSATDIASSVRDTFAGSSSNGWGTSDSGHAWTIGAGTASLFSETSGVGRIAISALNTVHHISVDVGYAARQRVRVYNTLAVTPTGAPINWGVLLRYVDASNYYWIDVQVSTAGVLTLRVISVISSVVTQLATATSRTAHSTSVARILIAEIGDDDLIRAKVYANGATEPSDWELVHQASTTDLQTGTRVGCIGRLMTGNTNVGPVNVDFDNFAVLNPQTMTVTRSVNGVVKAQSAGAAVNVYRPARLAL